MRVILCGVCLTILAGLAACTEKPQTLGSRKSDSLASAGTGSAYVAPGWKPGDQASWDEQMRTRAQQGQNEYSRAAAGS